MTVHDGHDLEIFECPAYKETSSNVYIEPLYEIIDDDFYSSQADGNTSHNVPIADDCDDHGHKLSIDNASDLDQDVHTAAECTDTGQYINIGTF